MKISFHINCGFNSKADFVQALEFSEDINALEILSLLGAQYLAVWKNGSQASEMFRKGPLEEGVTYHIYARNEERVISNLRILTKIGK